MPWLYKTTARPVLFACDAERIHERTLRTLAMWGRWRFAANAVGRSLKVKDPRLAVRLFGVEFPNPIGLAAGLDKNAVALPVWEHLGFGFVELGTVTAHPQPGNPKPRIFRLPGDEAIVNRLGFPNEGAEAIAERLAHFRSRGLWPSIPVGINIGKSASVPLDQATADYLDAFGRLREFGDFFVLNVSSPNTAGLRQLQDKPRLDELLGAIQRRNSNGEPRFRSKPLLLKIAPDLERTQLDDIIELAFQHKLSGLIATNTTVSRPETLSADATARLTAIGAGGLSGRPLRDLSTHWIRQIYKAVGDQLPILGVGGVFTAADACDKLRAGASLCQLYTGLVYEGPAAVRRINLGLLRCLEHDGFTTIRQETGAGADLPAGAAR